ncbi:MAG: stage 0 sporulation family protein [Clostridiales bacterium]|nr:stage 0 sporulation family protein [Clostridiales bacterium]
MSIVIGVRFKKAGKIYYFDPDAFEIEKGQNVIVETSRGIEYGHVVIGRRDIPDEELFLPLKNVLRVSDPDDDLKNKENMYKQIEAREICISKIKEHQLEMKLIDVEYTFDNNKVIFYFTSEGRVDFRDLVKDLASIFKTRIELRQIGVRDEAKFVNGIGQCGLPLCCANWLGDFQPVSIKMAKDQNLSLSPTKISGICGRLMCCLKYEHDTYIDLKKEMPSKGQFAKTEKGVGEIIDVDIFKQRIQVLHRPKGDDGEKEIEWVMKKDYDIVKK